MFTVVNFDKRTGFVTAYATGSSRPDVSTVNFSKDPTFAVANSDVVPPDASGSIDVYASASTDLIIDINGYFVEGVVTSLTAGTGLTGGGTGTVTVGIANGGVGTTQLSASGSTGGQVLTSNGGAVQWQNATVSGPAGGDLSGAYPNPSVAIVGGQTAANVASGTALANAATAANSGETIVRRDSSGNFSAGTITLGGNLALPATTAGTAGVISLGGSRFSHNFGLDNTFVGLNAGNFTMSGFTNTAVGARALSNNTTGNSNTATGAAALLHDTDGSFNTADGNDALASNTAGVQNTAIGAETLGNNTTGLNNTAVGTAALLSNITGNANTALGAGALSFSNSRENTAVGAQALLGNTTGAGNIAIGNQAGFSLTTGFLNIDIGNLGVAGESTTIRIGTNLQQSRAFIAGINGVTTGGPGVPVFIDANGQLGTNGASTPTSSNTPNTVVQRDGSGNFAAGTITAALSGNATTAMSATNFSGPLAGEVSGTQATTVVSNAVSGNASNAIVRRDAAGNFSAGTVALGGNLELPATTSASAGVINVGGVRFGHTYGTYNTFVGGSGNFSMTGTENVALGFSSFLGNTTGRLNTATGDYALESNSTGSWNTATGALALNGNHSGSDNTAVGFGTLVYCTAGSSNTSTGSNALRNTTGSNNTGNGLEALYRNTDGNYNTAVGSWALYSNTTGWNNIGIGPSAGVNLTNGNSNIDIGNSGVADEDRTIRIGDLQMRTFVAGIRGVMTGNADAVNVVIDSNGQLGTLSSSRRYKFDISEMGNASDGLMRLRPVTFRYLKYGENGPLQYGLIAEEVADVYPELVARNKDGEVETVMYQYLTPMLLNEVQKQERTIESLTNTITALERRLEALEREGGKAQK